MFRKYYSTMNEDEVLLCKQMRGLTETLHGHNVQVRDLITAHATFYAELPELKALYEHLDLWISRYNHRSRIVQTPVSSMSVWRRANHSSADIDDKIRRRLTELQGE